MFVFVNTTRDTLNAYGDIDFPKSNNSMHFRTVLLLTNESFRESNLTQCLEAILGREVFPSASVPQR